MQKLNDLGRSLTPLESDCTLTVQRYHRAENSWADFINDPSACHECHGQERVG
jgi:hypothetical protein